MRVCILALLFVLVCGCSDKPPKNHAVRVYPSAEATEKWTDFSGDYVVKRITNGLYSMSHHQSVIQLVPVIPPVTLP